MRGVVCSALSIVAALMLFDCAAILGINPTEIDNALGEGGGGGGGGGTGFQAPTIDAPTVPFDPACIKSVRAIYKDGNFAPDTIAADDRGVFWSGNSDAETGYMRALTSEGQTLIVDQVPSVQGTAIDHDHLYFSTMNDYLGNRGPALVRAWDRGGSHTVTTLGFGAAPPGAGQIAVNATELFFGSYTFLDDAGSGIFKASTPLGESTTLTPVASALSPFHLAADSQNVYFDEAPEGFAGTADGYKFTRLSKAPRNGGSPTVIDDNTSVADIEVANGTVYWATDYLLTVRSYDGQTPRDYAQISGAADLAADVADGELYVLAVPDVSACKIQRLPLGQAGATPKDCIGPMPNTYSIAYYGHHLYFGAKDDASGVSVLYDAEVNP